MFDVNVLRARPPRSLWKVRGWLGIALVAALCAADELRSGALVPVFGDDPLVSIRTLWAL